MDARESVCSFEAGKGYLLQPGLSLSVLNGPLRLLCIAVLLLNLPEPPRPQILQSTGKKLYVLCFPMVYGCPPVGGSLPLQGGLLSVRP